MKTTRGARATLLATLALFPFVLAAAADADRIEGRWLTFDGETHARRSLIEIARQGDRVTGRIVDIYSKPGEDPDPVCETCPGADRGRKIRGLTILRLERAREAAQFHGTVLDPENGRLYQCVATLEHGGKRLDLRGYVLVKFFGRSEAWVRVEQHRDTP